MNMPIGVKIGAFGARFFQHASSENLSSNKVCIPRVPAESGVRVAAVLYFARTPSLTRCVDVVMDAAGI